MKKSLLGVVLCVALLISVIGAALAMPTFAAGEIDLLANASSNGDGATVTTENGVVSADITTAWNSATDAAYGIAVEPQITGFDMTNQGYVHIKLNATTPFRITLLDRSASGDKWISFGSEFFNTIVTVGSEAGTSAPANGFFAAGEYDCIAYLGGVYSWKTNQGEAGWDIANTNITALYIEGKTEGNITIEHFVLSSDASCECETTTTTESTESTTEATESTTEATEATTEATKATTTIPEDAYIVYTIETVEHEGNVVAGEEIAVNITSSEAANIGGMGLIIAYDPAVLEVVGTEEAGWFAASGMSDINVMESEIRFNSMDLAGANSAADEVIATLTFKALVDITDEVVLDATSADVVSSADVSAVLTAWATDGAIVVVEPTTTESTTTTETEPSATETEPSTTETEPSATETTKGDDTTATTTVTTTTKVNESPKTGDASNALLLVVIAAAAAVVLTVSVKKVKA